MIYQAPGESPRHGGGRGRLERPKPRGALCVGRLTLQPQCLSAPRNTTSSLQRNERNTRNRNARENEKSKLVSLDDFKLSRSDAPPAFPALPYTWIQKLVDVDIEVAVPKGTRARDVAVDIRRKNLSVGLKNKEPVMSGELCREIKIEDSTWTIGLYSHSASLMGRSDSFRETPEDQERVCVHLEKIDGQKWWENVLTHHPKIDTTKIEPENSKLSDLDGETR